jgi:hypothetical protein
VIQVGNNLNSNVRFARTWKDNQRFSCVMNI